MGDLVLDREDVVEVAVEAFSPQVAAVLAVDQLGVDAHAIAGLAHASLQDRAHAEVLAHLRDVGRLALVGEGGVAGDDEQARNLGQIGDDVLGDAVGEILLLGIARHVVEGQHCDRGLVG